jgi:hypothetical protein
MPIKREKFDSLWYFDFEDNLTRILNTIGAEEIKETFMAAYDKLANIEENEAGSAIKGKDPMSLKNLRGVFERQIQRELASARFEEGGLVIGLMNRDLLGYAGATPTGPVDTVDIMAFYLEGIPDEHAFITIEQYEAGRKGSSRGKHGGRLGAGFMMPRKAYEKEGWEKITGLSFAEVRHPISSQKAYNGFDNLASEIDMDKYIRLALEQTNRALEKQ